MTLLFISCDAIIDVLDNQSNESKEAPVPTEPQSKPTTVPVEPKQPTVEQPLPLMELGAPLAAATGIEGQNFVLQLPAYGGMPPYKWALFSGTLPSGLGLGSDGRITGSPITGGPQGYIDFTVAVTDSEETTVAGKCRILIVSYEDSPHRNQQDFLVDAPKLVMDRRAEIVQRDSYFAARPSASGGVLPWTFNYIGLPKGVTFDSATGLIQGPLTNALESIILTIRIRDADGKERTDETKYWVR